MALPSRRAVTPTPGSASSSRIVPKVASGTANSGFVPARTSKGMSTRSMSAPSTRRRCGPTASDTGDWAATRAPSTKTVTSASGTLRRNVTMPRSSPTVAGGVGSIGGDGSTAIGSGAGVFDWPNKATPATISPTTSKPPSKPAKREEPVASLCHL